MSDKLFLLILTTTLLLADVRAESITMTDYNLLRKGMTEAEILYRVGPYDHETVNYDYFHNILHKTWYYIPGQAEISDRQWITEVRFNASGIVEHLDRYRARQ